MKKYCEDCKWNSYNMEVKRLKSMNFIQRFLVLTFMEWRIKIEKKYPKCCHPEVFHSKETFVFKEKSNEKMYCSIARTCPTSTWKTCGKDGKYFEENE